MGGGRFYGAVPPRCCASLVLCPSRVGFGAKYQGFLACCATAQLVSEFFIVEHNRQASNPNTFIDMCLSANSLEQPTF